MAILHIINGNASKPRILTIDENEVFTEKYF